MELKIHNTETVSMRITGKFYYYLMQRAEKRNMTVSAYVKQAIIKYTEWKEPPTED